MDYKQSEIQQKLEQSGLKSCAATAVYRILIRLVIIKHEPPRNNVYIIRVVPVYLGRILFF